jgi:hypothetical protein
MRPLRARGRPVPEVLGAAGIGCVRTDRLVYEPGNHLGFLSTQKACKTAAWTSDMKNGFDQSEYS